VFEPQIRRLKRFIFMTNNMITVVCFILAIILGSSNVYNIAIEAITKIPRRITRCAYVKVPVDTTGPKRYPCQPRTVGSIVRITQEHVNIHLTLCEVEVYAINGKIILHSNIHSIS